MSEKKARAVLTEILNRFEPGLSNSVIKKIASAITSEFKIEEQSNSNTSVLVMWKVLGNAPGQLPNDDTPASESSADSEPDTYMMGLCETVMALTNIKVDKDAKAEFKKQAVKYYKHPENGSAAVIESLEDLIQSYEGIQ